MGYSAKSGNKNFIFNPNNHDNVKEKSMRLLSKEKFDEISAVVEEVLENGLFIRKDQLSKTSLNSKRNKFLDLYVLSRNFQWWSVLILYLFSRMEIANNITLYKNVINDISRIGISVEDLNTSLNEIIPDLNLKAIQVIETTNLSLLNITRGALCLECCRDEKCKKHYTQTGGNCLDNCLRRALN
ncbi:MAG: hypothetical protein AB7V56_06845 [Candidatus Nitrosocosmicus sp.]